MKNDHWNDSLPSQSSRGRTGPRGLLPAMLLQSLQGDVVAGEATVPLADLELQDGMRVELWQTLLDSGDPIGDGRGRREGRRRVVRSCVAG